MTYSTIIIGSGISGIFTLKHLIEEGNKNVLVLDKNPEPFGVWNRKNHPCVYENTHTVSSKLYMTISDFPLPEETPEFPHHSVILNYYKDYATHFHLYPYIRQNVQVRSVKKENNVWVIKTNDSTFYSENIVVAAGTVNECPNIPNDEFYNHFTGVKLHSDSFDKIKNVEGKKILIVGGSDTGIDSAMELKNKNQVTFSIKSGVWFQNRIFGAYEPADMFYNRVLDFFIKKITSKKYADDVVNSKLGNTPVFWWGERGSGIDIWRSKCGYLNSYYVKSREIIELVSKGIIKPENKIIGIHENQVTFETGNTDKFDIILFCTGYKPLKCMRFLDDDIVHSQKYKHIFYTKDPSIMFIGYVRPYLTSIPMITELQSRWIAKVICKKVGLPELQSMETENTADDLKQQKEFPCAYERLKTIIDPYSYCNMVADKINANVSWIRLFFTDISFFYKTIFGSWNHMIYRLNDENMEKRQIAVDSIKNVYNEKMSTKVHDFIFNFLFNTVKEWLFYMLLIITIIYILYQVLVSWSVTQPSIRNIKKSVFRFIK